MLSGKAFELLGNSPFFGMDPSGWLFVAYMAVLVLAKGAATALTGAAGGIGGIFAPSLFMGSVTGFVLARALRLVGLPFANELNFALVGMAGVLAALLKAPLTSVFLIAEITGATASSCPSSSPRASPTCSEGASAPTRYMPRSWPGGTSW